MSFFDRIDSIKTRQEPKPEEPPKAIPMPKLSFDEIDALQQEQAKVERKKPGPKPKAKP